MIPVGCVPPALPPYGGVSVHEGVAVPGVSVSVEGGLCVDGAWGFCPGELCLGGSLLTPYPMNRRTGIKTLLSHNFIFGR